MIKYNRIMTAGLGDGPSAKTVSFTGREKFRVDDDAFKKGLIAIGIFREQEDGTLRYVGDITVTDKQGAEHKVDADGYLPLRLQDLPELVRRDFV